MLALKALVIGMGVLIVAGVAVIGVTLANRMSARGGQPFLGIVLDEPAGTRIVGSSLGPDRLAVTLQGGGLDRVAIVDTKSERVLGYVGLAR